MVQRRLASWALGPAYLDWAGSCPLLGFVHLSLSLKEPARPAIIRKKKKVTSMDAIPYHDKKVIYN
jgi:hypothetical protein